MKYMGFYHSSASMTGDVITVERFFHPFFHEMTHKYDPTKGRVMQVYSRFIELRSEDAGRVEY